MPFDWWRLGALEALALAADTRAALEGWVTERLGPVLARLDQFERRAADRMLDDRA